MPFLVLIVLDNVDQCMPVLDAWEAAGARGVTILESSGIGRMRRAQIRDDFPLMPSLQRILKGEEHRHRTLFSVVETEAEAQRLVEAAERVVGDFSRPDTGLLFVAPLLEARGLHKRG